MPHARYPSEEIAARGQVLYEREIRHRLEPGARGKFLVLDVEAGDYELDVDELAALKRAHARCPAGAFYVLRVGHSTAYRLGRRAVIAGAVRAGGGGILNSQF